MRKFTRNDKLFLILIALIAGVSLIFIWYRSDREEKSPKQHPDTTQEIEESEEVSESDSNDNQVEEVDKPEEEPPSEPSQPTEPIVTTQNWWEYPADIMQTTRSGDDLLVLVNKKYQLPSTYAPSDIVQLNNINIRLPQTIYARSIIVDDLTDLGAAAGSAGIDLSIVSGYRSYQTQASTYQYWVDFNGGDIAATDMVSARAGHSQHQLGTTIDFSSSEVSDQIGPNFSATAAAAWLERNAWKYGFVIAYPAGAESITGYAYESWHYRYIGVENAAQWKASGLTLEEWLQTKN